MGNPGLPISHLSYLPTYLFPARSPATPPPRHSGRGNSLLALTEILRGEKKNGYRSPARCVIVSRAPGRPRTPAAGLGQRSRAAGPRLISVQVRAGTRPSPRPRRPPPRTAEPPALPGLPEPRSPRTAAAADCRPPAGYPPLTLAFVFPAGSAFRGGRPTPSRSAIAGSGSPPPSPRRARWHPRGAPWPRGAQGPHCSTPFLPPPPRLPRQCLPCPRVREGSAGRKGAHGGPPAPAVGQGGHYPLHFTIKETE